MCWPFRREFLSASRSWQPASRGLRRGGTGGAEKPSLLCNYRPPAQRQGTRSAPLLRGPLERRAPVGFDEVDTVAPRELNVLRARATRPPERVGRRPDQGFEEPEPLPCRPTEQLAPVEHAPLPAKVASCIAAQLFLAVLVTKMRRQKLSRPVEDCEGCPALAWVRNVGLDDPGASCPDLPSNFGDRRSVFGEHSDVP